VIREIELTPGRPGHRLPGPLERRPRVDRRREARYATNDPVEIEPVDGGGGPRVKGKVLDMSRSGLRIELPIPIGKGLRLKIVLPDQTIILAEARHCRHVSSLYHVGVVIQLVDCALPTLAGHLQSAELNLYLLGKGLSAVEAIQIKNHLFSCASCQARLEKTHGLQGSCSGSK
jgi:PilZ domain